MGGVPVGEREGLCQDTRVTVGQRVTAGSSTDPACGVWLQRGSLLISQDSCQYGGPEREVLVGVNAFPGLRSPPSVFTEKDR